MCFPAIVITLIFIIGFCQELRLHGYFAPLSETRINAIFSCGAGDHISTSQRVSFNFWKCIPHSGIYSSFPLKVLNYWCCVQEKYCVGRHKIGATFANPFLPLSIDIWCMYIRFITWCKNECICMPELYCCSNSNVLSSAVHLSTFISMGLSS